MPSLLSVLLSLVLLLPQTALAGDQRSFDPQNPLPGRKKEKPTGPRAILPALLSLGLATGGTILAKEVILEGADLGDRTPPHELLTGLVISAAPSVGRLLVPSGHPIRAATLLSLGRFAAVNLFFAARTGVSEGGERFASVVFLGISAADVVSTAFLRFPEKNKPSPSALLPGVLPGRGIGLLWGGSF